MLRTSPVLASLPRTYPIVFRAVDKSKALLRSSFIIQTGRWEPPVLSLTDAHSASCRLSKAISQLWPLAQKQAQQLASLDRKEVL